MTGLTFPANVARSLEAGFDHHLVKPFDPKELERVVRGQCDHMTNGDAKNGVGCRR
jgi:DNA-binding response OmpR family regulator